MIYSTLELFFVFSWINIILFCSLLFVGKILDFFACLESDIQYILDFFFFFWGNSLEIHRSRARRKYRPYNSTVVTPSRPVYFFFFFCHAVYTPKWLAQHLINQYYVVVWRHVPFWGPRSVSRNTERIWSRRRSCRERQRQRLRLRLRLP